MKKQLQRIVFTFSVMLVFLPFASNGQGEANVWYFGNKAGLDFNTNPPTLLSDGSVNAGGGEGEGVAAISDAAGNLLFYTNGVTIWASDHSAMPNGTGLMGNNSTTQSAVIVPYPGNPDRYYVFTAPLTGSSNRVRYNVVDMTLNGGLGDVVGGQKNIIMPGCPTYMMEAIMSVPDNATGYWLVGHRAGAAGSSNSTNEFYSWHITAGGVQAPVVSAVGYNLPSANILGSWVSQGQGIIKFNTCFNKIFISHFAQGANGRVEMMDFDKATGSVTGPTIVINNFVTPNEVYGIEVSPSGDYLYVSELGQTNGTVGGNDERIHQFDLSSGVQATINASRFTLMSGAPGPYYFRTGQLQLAPNGKIYVSHHNWNTIGAGGGAQLGVINNPDVGGAGCGYQNAPAALQWSTNGVGSTHGLPQFPRYFVAGVGSISAQDTACVGETVNLSYLFSGSAVSVSWTSTGSPTFSPGGASSTDPAPTVSYATAGTKALELEITDGCGNVTILRDTIEVFPDVTSSGSISCNPARGNVASPNPSYTYVWYSDAAGTQPIATGTTNVSLPIQGTGNVYLAATTGASSSAVPLTNGTDSDNHPWGGSDAGTSHSMGFTVTAAPLMFNSFEWEAPYLGWAAANDNTTFSVEIRNSGGTAVYSNTRSVATRGPSWVNGYPFTENVNTSLPLGTYTIVIEATSGPGGPIKTMNGCISNELDAENALTFATNGVCGIAASFSYTLTKYVDTPLPCSQIAVVPYNCPLPVTFLAVSATPTNEGYVQVNWSTASEENNDYFIVERSVDGKVFEAIGQVNGAGNSNSVLSYSFMDYAPLQGVSYYRITQVDFDGSSASSKIVAVNLNNAVSISVSPNPSNGSFTINGLSEAQVTIIDALGRNVYAGHYEGNNGITVSTDLPEGLYILKVNGSATEHIQKIIIE